MRSYYESYWRDPETADPVSDSTTGQRISLLSKLLDGQSRVLDVGCGEGAILRSVESQTSLRVGTDIALPALRSAIAKRPDTGFVCAGADEGLPFRSEAFDVVFAGDIIEHLFDCGAFIKEVHRVLKPDGLLALTLPCHQLAKRVLISAFFFERHFDPEGAHIRFFTQKSLTRLLARNGFRAESTKYYGRVWPLYQGMFTVARRLG